MGRAPKEPIDEKILQKRNVFYHRLGDKLNHARKHPLNKRDPMRQEDFATLCGYSKAYIQKAEEGKGAYDVYLIAEYVENFGYSPNYFFEDALEAAYKKPGHKQQMYLNDLQKCVFAMDEDHKRMLLNIARMFAKLPVYNE